MKFTISKRFNYYQNYIQGSPTSGRDRMVVEFTTTYTISAYHHYVIKFVSDSRQIDGFLRVLRFPLPINLTATI